MPTDRPSPSFARSITCTTATLVAHTPTWPCHCVCGVPRCSHDLRPPGSWVVDGTDGLAAGTPAAALPGGDHSQRHTIETRSAMDHQSIQGAVTSTVKTRQWLVSAHPSQRRVNLPQHLVDAPAKPQQQLRANSSRHWRRPTSAVAVACVQLSAIDGSHVVRPPMRQRWETGRRHRKAMPGSVRRKAGSRAQSEQLSRYGHGPCSCTHAVAPLAYNVTLSLV